MCFLHHYRRRTCACLNREFSFFHFNHSQRKALVNFTRFTRNEKRINVKRISPSPSIAHSPSVPGRDIFYSIFYCSSRIFFRKVNVLIARFLWPFLACRLLGKVYSKPYLCTLASIGNSRLSSNTLRALDSFRPEVLRFFSRLHATLRRFILLEHVSRSWKRSYFQTYTTFT